MAEEAEEAAAGAPVRIYRKKDLVAAVATASGVKKKVVKPVVDAILAEMGAVLQRGDALNVPPLGKLTVNRTREGVKSDLMILKLRRLKQGVEDEGEPEPPEDDGEK